MDMLTYNLCNSQPTMFFFYNENNLIMRSKSREPGNQETKTTTKTKTNSNSRSARLFQMFPLLLLLNATNPASTRQIEFFCNFFYLMCHLYWSTGGWWTPSLPLPPTWYFFAGSPFSCSSTRWLLLSDMRGIARLTHLTPRSAHPF